MKLAFVTLLFAAVAVSSHYAAEDPGYRYSALFREERSSSDNPGSTTIYIELTGEKLPEREIAIGYDTKTRRIMSACWMTKGMFEIDLPRIALYVPARPKEERNLSVMLSVKRVTDVQMQRIALAGLYWEVRK